MDIKYLADELLQVNRQLNDIISRNRELRRELATLLDDQPYDHEGCRFTRKPETTVKRINKKKLIVALSSAGLSDEIQAKIKSEAFDDCPVPASVRISKIKPKTDANAMQTG